MEHLPVFGFSVKIRELQMARKARRATSTDLTDARAEKGGCPHHRRPRMALLPEIQVRKVIERFNSREDAVLATH